MKVSCGRFVREDNTSTSQIQVTRTLGGVSGALPTGRRRGRGGWRTAARGSPDGRTATGRQGEPSLGSPRVATEGLAPPNMKKKGPFATQTAQNQNKTTVSRETDVQSEGVAPGTLCEREVDVAMVRSSKGVRRVAAHPLRGASGWSARETSPAARGPPRPERPARAEGTGALEMLTLRMDDDENWAAFRHIFFGSVPFANLASKKTGWFGWEGFIFIAAAGFKTQQ